MSRRTRDPDIPQERGEFAQRAKQVLDTMLGRAGDQLDQVVRFRDLVDGGLATVEYRNGRGIGGSSGPGGPGGSGTPGGPFLVPRPPGSDPIPNGHINVRTASAWDSIIIKWDWPRGQVNYAFTEVWAAPAQTVDAPSPPFGQATLIGTSEGNLFVHTGVGLNKSVYYWLRYVGFATGGNAPPMSSFTPGSSGPGVKGTTVADPAYVLGVLAGQITESQLYGLLNNRIDLVDGNGPGSVNARLLAQATNLQGNISAAIAQFAAITQNNMSISATYGLQVDVEGYIAGFGIGVEQQRDPVTGNPRPIFDAQGRMIPGALSSTFIIRTDKFAIVRPQVPGFPTPADYQIPFVVGQIPNPAYNPNLPPSPTNLPDINTVGINGQLVVNGTIVASQLQAGTIGAREINATQVWAGIVSANRVFASQFATSDDTNFRAVIGGGGSNFPFWYGSGSISDTTTASSNPVFYVDRNGNVGLAGNMNVTGAGRFSTSGGANDARVEIGGNDGFALWLGSGQRNVANAKMYFGTDGTLVIRGNPVSFPYASGGQSVTIQVRPPDGQSTAAVMCHVFAVIGAGTNEREKTLATRIKIGSSVVDELFISTRQYVFPVNHVGILNLPGGSHTLTFEAEVTEVSGGGIPAVQYFNVRFIALQVVSAPSA